MRCGRPTEDFESGLGSLAGVASAGGGVDVGAVVAPVEIADSSSTARACIALLDKPAVAPINVPSNRTTIQPGTLVLVGRAAIIYRAPRPRMSRDLKKCRSWGTYG